MSTHLETRKKLKDIPDLARFDDLLESSTLTEELKTILRLHYLKEKDFKYIGDILGYAESTIKKKHAKALSKLSKLL